MLLFLRETDALRLATLKGEEEEAREDVGGGRRGVGGEVAIGEVLLSSKSSSKSLSVVVLVRSEGVGEEGDLGGSGLTGLSN